jgi:hypothetical protein
MNEKDLPPCEKGYRYLENGVDCVKDGDQWMHRSTCMQYKRNRTVSAPWLNVISLRKHNRSNSSDIVYRRKVEVRKYRPVKAGEAVLNGDEAFVGTFRSAAKWVSIDNPMWIGCVIPKMEDVGTDTLLMAMANTPVRREIPLTAFISGEGPRQLVVHYMGAKVKVTDKSSRFFGVTGKVVGNRTNGIHGTAYRVKYDAPQEKELYRYSWFWYYELETIVEQKKEEPKPTDVKFKSGDRVRSWVDGKLGVVKETYYITNPTHPKVSVEFDDGSFVRYHLAKELMLSTPPTSAKKLELGSKVEVEKVKGGEYVAAEVTSNDNSHTFLINQVDGCHSLYYVDNKVNSRKWRWPVEKVTEKPAPAPDNNAPKWRYLKEGETIEKGDELCSPVSPRDWSEKVGPISARESLYRRKI